MNLLVVSKKKEVLIVCPQSWQFMLSSDIDFTCSFEWLVYLHQPSEKQILFVYKVMK